MKLKKRPKKNNMLQEALHSETGAGFLESLVAIVIGGIACTALLSVAVGVIREANNNQIRDGMNLYAMQGLEKVRVIAAENYANKIEPLVCTVAGHSDAKIQGNTIVKREPAVHPDFCSDIGATGFCEKLTFKDGGSDFYYRELEIRRASTDPSECYKARVTVRVGVLDDVLAPSGTTHFIASKEIIGYVAE